MHEVKARMQKQRKRLSTVEIPSRLAESCKFFMVKEYAMSI